MSDLTVFKGDTVARSAAVVVVEGESRQRDFSGLGLRIEHAGAPPFRRSWSRPAGTYVYVHPDLYNSARAWAEETEGGTVAKKKTPGKKRDFMGVYKHYDTSKGYGDAGEASRTFAERMGGVNAIPEADEGPSLPEVQPPEGAGRKIMFADEGDEDDE